jgi:hypothetical protein
MKKSLDEEEDVFINFVKKFDPEVREECLDLP